MSALNLTIRASSLADLADCPARWYAKHVDGMRTPSGPAAVLGSAIHASTAAYDQSRIDNAGLTASDAAGALVDYLGEHHSEADWSDADYTVREAERIGLSLHARYCTEIAPSREYVTVEADLGLLSIAVPDADAVITLTGHTDRIRRIDATVNGLSDLKSGGRAVGADGSVKVQAHAYQVAAYKLLYQEMTGERLAGPVEIIGLNTGKNAATQRVGIGVAEDVEETLLGTDSEPGLIQAVAHMAKAGMFWGNPRSMLCSGKYCAAYATCRFRK